MSDAIVARDLGIAVYGQSQVDYTVNGAKHKDFGEAVAFASLAQATAIEVETAALADIVRARTRKIEELGNVLAYLASAIAKLPGKNPGSDDKAPLNPAAATIAAKYGITISMSGGNATRAVLQRSQSTVQFAIDTEDNNLQQDTISAQGYVSKRDGAYSTAAKLVKKFAGTGSAMIRNMAG